MTEYVYVNLKSEERLIETIDTQSKKKCCFEVKIILVSEI
jgi:hypothetical protein